MFIYICLAFAAFLVMVHTDREYIAQKAFLAVAFFCVRWQSWRIVACISNEIFWFLMEAFPDRSTMFWFVEYVIQTGVDQFFGCLLLYGAVKCMLWAYGCRREHMNVKEFLLLAAPAVFGVFAYGMLRFYHDIYQRDTGQSPWNLYGSYDWLMLLYSVLCFVTILVTAYVFRQWKNEQEEDKKREVFSRQVQDLENHIEEVKRLYRDMRNLRHDMGNHLMTLERLYDRGGVRRGGKVRRRKTGELLLDEQSGLPMTAKTGEGHGFGLENIRHAAHKYFGGMEIGKELYAGEECCVLRVMLQITES